MNNTRKTAIVTGASQGIGAGIVQSLVERGFNVVANSRKVTQSTEVAASDHVALVDGHIGEPTTAAKVVETAGWRACRRWVGRRRSRTSRTRSCT
jgi:NAD(P)-dependent dehydrogenase (short-subunit alcohol dehydrogenase family)